MKIEDVVAGKEYRVVQDIKSLKTDGTAQMCRQIHGFAGAKIRVERVQYSYSPLFKEVHFSIDGVESDYALGAAWIEELEVHND